MIFARIQIYKTQSTIAARAKTFEIPKTKLIANKYPTIYNKIWGFYLKKFVYFYSERWDLRK